MSLPNSPLDPYPEAFGWPWHGLIRRREDTGAVDLLLPSGATRAMNEFGGCDTHPFVVPGLPAPDLPVEDDQAWWNYGILRGDNASVFWDRPAGGSAAPCVVAGVPLAWGELGYYWLEGGVELSIRLYNLATGEAQLYRQLLPPDPFQTGIPGIPSLSLELSMNGGAGDRRLYMARASVEGVRRPAGVLEVVITSPTSVEFRILARTPQMQREVANVPSAVPQNTALWAENQFAPGTLELPYEDPPPAQWPNATRVAVWSTGTVSYWQETEWIVAAWYAADAVTVLLPTLSWRTIITYVLSRYSELWRAQYEFRLNGQLALQQTVEETYSYSAAQQQYGRTVTINGAQLYSDSRTETSSPRGTYFIPEPLQLGTLPARLATMVGFRTEYSVAVNGFMVKKFHLDADFRRLSNALYAFELKWFYGAAYYNADGEIVSAPDQPMWLEQSDAISPAGLSSAATQVTGLPAVFTKDALRNWRSGSWQPFTGQVERASLTYQYSWV